MKATDIKTIAVLGTGSMGQGIAQVCASSGFRTLVFDVKPEFRDRGLRAIHDTVQTSFDKGKISDDQKRRIEENIFAAAEIADLVADVVIEAVTESLVVKQKLFAAVEAVSGPDTIFATNTSSLSVTDIGSVLRNPSRCIGLHFFNPAHIMKLVEIVAGRSTSPEVVATVKAFSEALGKVAVMANDSPGFIVNRVARHFYLESLRALSDDAASVEGIDSLLRSAGFKMGPFELMDMIGIDVNYAVTVSTYNAFNGAVRFQPNPLQRQKVEAGELGRKTGRGFYDYPAK